MEMNKKIPILRFVQYSDLWTFKNLNKATSYVDYRGKTPEKTKEGVFLVTAKNIKMGYIDYVCSKEYISFSSYNDVMRRGKPLIGDVLITTEAPLGNVASIDQEGIALAQRVIKFRGESEILLNCYLKHYFTSTEFQRSLESKATGSTAKGIKGSVLHKMEIAYPSLPEQQKIADFLTSVDTKIQQLSKKKALLEEYKKGVMQKLFNQEIRFKDVNGNDYPDWEEKRLGEVFEIFNGYAFSSTHSLTYGVKWVKIADVGIQRMKEDSPSFLPLEFINRYNKFMLKKGDYVIALTRPILNGKLKIACVDQSYDNSLLNQRVGKIVSSNSTDFVYYLLQLAHVIKSIESNIAGTDPPNLSPAEISPIKVLVPRLAEQQKIASYLLSIDRKSVVLDKQLNNITKFKKGLLQQMFV